MSDIDPYEISQQNSIKQFLEQLNTQPWGGGNQQNVYAPELAQDLTFSTGAQQGTPNTAQPTSDYTDEYERPENNWNPNLGVDTSQDANQIAPIAELAAPAEEEEVDAGYDIEKNEFGYFDQHPNDAQAPGVRELIKLATPLSALKALLGATAGSDAAGETQSNAVDSSLSPQQQAVEANITGGLSSANYSSGGTGEGGSYGGPSANFSGMHAAVGPTGITTVSDDDMGFIDNTGKSIGFGKKSSEKGANGENDGGAGETHLCTVAYDYGYIDLETFQADCLVGRSVPPWLYKAYSVWALPLSKLARKRAWLRVPLMVPVTMWARSMKALVDIGAIKDRRAF